MIIKSQCMRDGIECFSEVKETAHTSFPFCGALSHSLVQCSRAVTIDLPCKSPIDRQLVGDGTEGVP